VTTVSLPRANPRTKKIVKEIFKKLTRLSSSMGGFSIGPFAQSTEPGRSFHSGGTFPMSLHPGEYESDILGRPFKLKRVHVVDSSVLPSIPATTITLSVMANAYRIGATNLMDER
jgi:choline dehydrogenase-like flavoprotein